MSEPVHDAFSRFHHPDVAPIRSVGEFKLLELFWGPTLSFKDHALQVLSRLFKGYLTERQEATTVLVATSGDTGSAAIEAFRGLSPLRLVVLYPKGMVSDFQRRQMTTVVDSNVTVVSVEGSFDDCQGLAKEAFVEVPGLASANSINWGRLAAQVGYYQAAAARVSEPFDLVVPTGNFGNAYSAYLARAMGIPIRRITIATNANRVLFDLHHTGEVTAEKALRTLAPAMDIQVPSNLERYLNDHEPASFSTDFSAGWADDSAILATILKVYEKHGTLLDPHTAAAWSVAEDLDSSEVPTVVVSTAHPAKFAGTVEKATGVVPEVPEWATIGDDLKENEVSIAVDLAELKALL